MESKENKSPKKFSPELLHLEYSKDKIFRNYIKFYREDIGRLIYAGLLYVLKAAPVWIMPIVTANIINLWDSEAPNADWLILLNFLVGAAAIVQNVPTHVWFVRVLSKVTRKVEMNLRTSLCTRLQHLSIPYHTNNKLGVLQTKVLRDVENIEMLTRMLVESLPQILITFAVALTVTACRAPLFIIFYLATVPLAVLICKVMNRRMQRYNQEFRLSVESMSGKVIEMLRMIQITRAHNIEDDELNRVNAKLEEVKIRGLRLDFLNAIFNSVNWVTFMLFNMITLFAAVMLRRGGVIQIEVGDIVLLSTYFGSITGSVMQLLNTIPAISKGLESVRSIGEVLECPDLEMNAGKPAVHQLDGYYEFDHVTFSYENDASYAIRDFSLQIKPGETIALVGPSGSGKSTIMQLLIGFIRPTAGRILVDSHNMNDIDLRSYRRFLSVVSQETLLFDGTIRDNIVYGASNVTEEALEQAVSSANLAEFIGSLPEGLNTRVKENGARLSGGQKQRIAIARALLRNPRVLLLDEATSALDVESEALIQEALDRLIKGRTTFIVAHRLSTIRNANRIVVLQHGEIAEIGSHEELLARQGIYYRMNLLQSHEISAQEAAAIGKELEQ
ncbi:ABC transporter ATP-binding protein [Victivallis sp. Marseille-Q1083]|uniref:ABC transporter ATP-binding protein n=1 Tax=Victivallis sp. Marseille-Q1083 TaxID=2717288 RepID=UPI00158936E3|nr:ABC transporter ATP-binding protein [Victivallis sp. Marseille-Q1083]